MDAYRKEPNVPEQAAEWVIQREGELTPGELREFTAWLKASPRHVEEFLLAAAAWGRFDGIDAAKAIDVQRILAETGDNVVRMAAERLPLTSAPLPQGERGKKKMWWGFAAGVAVVAVTAGVALHLGRAPIYATDVGEQRSIKLADGSLIQLNTKTRVEAHLTDQAREVRLLDGEALFTVAHDAARPFRVESNGITIQALGTQFNVHRYADGARVSVIEGAVKVRAGEAEQRLEAGEEASVAIGREVDKHRTADIADAIAWRERRLVFRDATLEHIVTEFNRYNSGYRIELARDAGQDMRLTGVFRADDPEALLLYLAANTQLTVDRGNTASGTVTIR